MAPKIQHKRSAVAGKAPQPADLDYGEIGVNYEATDPALYIKDSANAIRKIGTQPDATESVKGIVQLATAAETTTGTNGAKAVHPAGLKVELDKKANQATTYTKTETDAALVLKANLASPALTGTPTAPTAAAGTSTTQIATTAFVVTAFLSKNIANLPALP
jgi:hypothetical protein